MLVATALCHFFVLIQKSNQKKSSQQKCFFAAQGLCRTIGQNLGWNLFAPLRSLWPYASAKSSYALQPHKATIVLADFGRSCSADGKASARCQFLWVNLNLREALLKQ
jgi:hypothetical protein